MKSPFTGAGVFTSHPVPVMGDMCKGVPTYGVLVMFDKALFCLGSAVIAESQA
ncbi:hypothetical protein WDW37_10525 [Bdellovibrionota bacterium FG-1]